MPVVENGDIPCLIPSASAYRGQHTALLALANPALDTVAGLLVGAGSSALATDPALR
ncbi:hypothetical protein [Nocardia vinacea]|uniref:hypothetical protein n=1 Tax=Nocardia vinacea TaxID=96468 RepID=UPI0012F65817|nr:hypothetical protein [Nocardia vinacea]